MNPKLKKDQLILDPEMIEKAYYYLDAYDVDKPTDNLSDDLHDVMAYLCNLAARAVSGSKIKVK